MDFIQANILTLITFTPLFGALIVLLLPSAQKGLIRWLTLLISLIPVGLAFMMWLWFRADPCHEIVARACFEVKTVWFPTINVNFHLGIDGVSLSLIVLTAILTPLAILMSWDIEDRVKLYMALFLILEMGMLGVFVSLDLLIWFIFYEFGLVPMYFLINIWGSQNREYASFKFMIYTIGGSLGLLLSLGLIGATMGTFDIPRLMVEMPAFAGEAGTLFGVATAGIKFAMFVLITVAFAIKVPLWPFHTWLPDAHTEAPTAGSMILAGVLLKLGAYGFVRIVLPLFPVEARTFSPVIAILAMLAIILGALAAFAQTDFKRLVAYSSVNHMGFVMLAIAAAAYAGIGGQFTLSGADKTNAIIALNGAVLQMFNHGVSAAAMFALVGMVYHRLHTRDLTQMGGLWVVAPVYGGIMVFTSMASLGLPGLNGFVSEFLVVRGAWPMGTGETPLFALITTVSLIGLFFTGAYVLKGIRFVLLGPLNQEAVARAHGHSLEINFREVVAMAPLLVLMLVLGVYPIWLLDIINSTITMLWS